jgi:hypothetical protein
VPRMLAHLAAPSLRPASQHLLHVLPQAGNLLKEDSQSRLDGTLADDAPIT